MRLLSITILLLTLVPPTPVTGQKDTISSQYILENVDIVSSRNTSHLRSTNNGNTIKWNMQMMHSLPKILGNADPMHYTQLLPGVQTNSEYDAGLHIQGCDNTHNTTAIGGVPIYNAAHLLGIFSTFNATHFPTMSFSKSPQNCTVSGRLGGEMNMELPDSIPDRTNGDFAMGLMSWTSTLRTPIKKERSALFVSFRTSYLNLLYGSFLKVDDNEIKYNFSDLNITYLHKINERNRLWFDVYHGNDNATITESTVSNMTMKWGNLMFAAHHRYNKENFSLEQSIYTTNYKNRFSLKRSESSFGMPSAIHDIGYSLSLTANSLKGGISAVWHNIEPQSPKFVTESEIIDRTQKRQNSVEVVMHGKNSTYIARNLRLGYGANAILYTTPSSGTTTSLNPAVTAEYENPVLGNIAVTWDIRHQYIFKTGVSSSGLPIEFWMSCDKDIHPQRSQNLSLSYTKEIFGGNYSFSIETYYKKLYNQIEYDGNIYDLYNNSFSLENSLIKGDGENYGINIMLNKLTGKLNGWLAFSAERALRRSPLYGNEEYPASHERLYELNAVATYKINDKFDVGATFVTASGTPFTAPSRFYMINGNLISEYEGHNANRLSPYTRLDLSMNYTFHKKENKEHILNLSVYNALSNSNRIYYRLKFHEGQYAYRGMGFLISVMPSISYYYKF